MGVPYEYRNSNLGITIHYSFDWSYQESKHDLTYYIDFRPPQINVSDVMVFRIAYGPMYGGGPWQHIDRQFNGIINMDKSKDYNIHRRESISIKRMNGYVISYTLKDRDNKTTDYYNITDNYFIPNGQNMYELHYLAHSGNYNKYLQMVNDMITSFKVDNYLPVSTPQFGAQNTYRDTSIMDIVNNEVTNIETKYRPW